MIVSVLARRAASLLALGLATLLLSACMLTSEANLFTPADAVQPLPETIAMVSYGETDGVLTRADDAPATFALKDGGYVASDGTMTAYFVPTDMPDTYTMAVVSTDGAIYGVARIRDGIAELSMIFSEDPGTQLTAAGVTAPAGANVADGGVVVTDRAALDAVLVLVREGKLKFGPLVVWVGAGEAPATLKREGDWYVAG